MALVGEDDVRHGNATLVHRRHDLIALRHLDPRIVRTLPDEQRLRDAVDVRERRDLVEPLGLALGADPLLEHRLHRRPVRRNRLKQRADVRRTDDVDAARPELGVAGHARKRRVATVAAAHDREPIRIGPALIDRPLRDVVHVVLHRLVPLAIARIEELLAEAGRAAEVDVQDGVAAIGEPLVIRVEAPAVAGPRSAVHHDDQRHPLAGLPVVRQRVVRRKHETIASRNLDRLHLHERKTFQTRPVAEEVATSLLVAVPEPVLHRTVIDEVRHDPATIVARAVDDLDLAIDERGELLEIGTHRFVENRPRLPQPVRRDGLRLLGDRVDHDVGDVAVVAREDRLAIERAVGIRSHRHEPGLVAAAGIDAPHDAAALVEADGAGGHRVLEPDLVELAPFALGTVAIVALGAAHRRHSRADPDVPVVIRHHPDEALVVLEDRRRLAGAGVEADDVHVLRITRIGLDEDLIGAITTGRKDPGLDAAARREVRGVAGRQIHRVDVRVLVARPVLRIQDLIVVPRPAVASDGPLGRLRDRHRLTAIDGHHPDVHDAVERCEIRDPRAVGRDLHPRAVRIAEERLTRDERHVGDGWKDEGEAEKHDGRTHGVDFRCEPDETQPAADVGRTMQPPSPCPTTVKSRPLTAFSPSGRRILRPCLRRNSSGVCRVRTS